MEMSCQMSWQEDWTGTRLHTRRPLWLKRGCRAEWNNDHDPDIEEAETQEQESVEAYIKKLQAEYDNFITSPCYCNLNRIPCLAHTLHLPILKMFEDEEGVFYDVLKKVNSEKF